VTDLHSEFAARGSFEHLRLGKAPAKKDPRTLKIRDYLKADELPAAPASVDYSTAVPSWPMYGNDRLGDCTCAAVGHMIQAWSANAGGMKTFDDADVEALYWSTGSGDTGRYELDVLNYWRATGVGQPAYADRITAYALIDASDVEALKQALWLFGGVYVGIALPETAQGQPVWDVVGDGRTGPSQPGSWGGHAVNLVGYSDDKLKLVTWGATLEMTEAFWRTYGDEAYAIVSTDWLQASGQSVTALDLDALLADLHAIDASAQHATVAAFGDPITVEVRETEAWLQKTPDGATLVLTSTTDPAGTGVRLEFDAVAWRGFQAFIAES
jgi:hypothetical protein